MQLSIQRRSIQLLTLLTPRADPGQGALPLESHCFKCKDIHFWQALLVIRGACLSVAPSVGKEPSRTNLANLWSRGNLLKMLFRQTGFSASLLHRLIKLIKPSFQSQAWECNPFKKPARPG